AELDGSVPFGVKRLISLGSRNAASELTVARANPLDKASLSNVLAPSADSSWDVVSGRPSLPPNHDVSRSPTPTRRNRSRTPSGPPVRSLVINDRIPVTTADTAAVETLKRDAA